MRTRLLLGAGLVLAAVLAARKLIEVAGRPLAELDELYPPPGDDYLHMLADIVSGARRPALIRPDVAQAMLNDERRWLRGDTPFQRLFRDFMKT